MSGSFFKNEMDVNHVAVPLHSQGLAPEKGEFCAAEALTRACTQQLCPRTGSGPNAHRPVNEEACSGAALSGTLLGSEESTLLSVQQPRESQITQKSRRTTESRQRAAPGR